MALHFRKPVDPVNEALRDNVEGPPKLDDTITALIGKTSNIHAGFLFDSIGHEALQQLCQCLSATKSSHLYKGWEDFGISLGLNPLQIKCIDFHFNNEDPAWYTLQAFVQKDDSTMDKIISTLQNMKRLDIINKVSELFIQLVDEVLRSQCVSSNNESGYFSLSTSPSSEEESMLVLNRNTIVRPPFVPEVPFVLKTFRSFIEGINDENRLTPFTRINSRGVESEGYQRSKREEKITKTDKKAQYTKTVMLTFATDGQTAANEIAEIFRRKEENEQRIGVLILNDHARRVNANPEQFIFSSFEQVDYIVPIITEGYLQAVSNSASQPNESSLLCMDPKYVLYIYTLMNTNYKQNGCINYKVRCLIPDRLLHLTYQHPLMCGPLFQAWASQGETEELKQRMLNTKF